MMTIQIFSDKKKYDNKTVFKFPQGVTVAHLVRVLSKIDHQDFLVCFGNDDTPAEVVYISNSDKTVCIDSKSPDGKNLNDHK